jgi:CBS domain-containing protein
MADLKDHQTIHFRDQLRDARAAALKDAEGFTEILQAIESLGEYLHGKAVGLARYKDGIRVVAGASPFANDLPKQFRELHTPFEILYDLVRDARNQAAHYGASARNLTDQAAELALIIEDALMIESHMARDYMVPDPICAAQWQPLSFCRQKMLLNSFSFLPVLVENGTEVTWHLLSDRTLAQFLRSPDEGDVEKVRRKRLATILEVAVSEGSLRLESAVCCNPSTPVEKISGLIGDQPVLIVDSQDERRLLGLITAFDLL